MSVQNFGNAILPEDIAIRLRSQIIWHPNSSPEIEIQIDESTCTLVFKFKKENVIAALKAKQGLNDTRIVEMIFRTQDPYKLLNIATEAVRDYETLFSEWLKRQ